MITTWGDILETHELDSKKRKNFMRFLYQFSLSYYKWGNRDGQYKGNRSKDNME